jgi:hypothetical protein
MAKAAEIVVFAYKPVHSTLVPRGHFVASAHEKTAVIPTY